MYKKLYSDAGWPRNRSELKTFDPALYKILLKVYGNSKWRFNYGPIYAKIAYKLSTAFDPALAKAATQNMFMVGEDFDLKIHASPAVFSFQDYQGIDDHMKSFLHVGFRDFAHCLATEILLNVLVTVGYPIFLTWT